MEITRFRWGIDDFSTAEANQSVGMFFLFQREYAKAEAHFRDCVHYWAKVKPTDGPRFFNELQYGISLLAQRKYSEAQNHLRIGYDGMRSDLKQSPTPDELELGGLIDQISRLRDYNVTSLSLLHRDPLIRAIVLDLNFPSDPFAH